MQVREYLDIVEKQIRQEQLRQEIHQELLGHIEEQADAFSDEGMSRSEAVEKAVEEMGDPVETGVALDQVHSPKLDVKLLLMVMGITIVVSVVQLLWSDVSESIRINSVTMWISLSVIVILSFSLGKFREELYQQMKWFWIIFVILGGVLTAVYTNFGRLSPDILETKDFYRGLLNASVAAFSVWVYRYRGGGEKKLRVLGVMALVPCVLSLMEHSYFHTLLLVLAHGILLSIGVCRGWYGDGIRRKMTGIWILPGIMTAGGIFLMGRSWEESRGVNPILAYLEVRDMPGILVGRFGRAGVMAVCVWGFCMLLIAWRMIYDVRKLTNEYCRVVCLGVLTAYGIQIVYSVLGILGYGVLGGVYFPFLSPNRFKVGLQIYLDFTMMGIFLFHSKFDRAIPKKLTEKTEEGNKGYSQNSVKAKL